MGGEAGWLWRLRGVASAFAKQRITELLAFLRGTWVFISFFALFALVLFIVATASWEFWAERTFDAKGAITEIKVDRLKIAQQFGLALLAVVGLGLAVWRSLTSHRQAIASLEQSRTAIKQAATAAKQAEIAENNQRFDRYARAAQMLDNEKIAVRQAGVYLLRELALSDASGYRALCTDLLAGFIRAQMAESVEELVGKQPSKGLFPILDKAKLELANRETSQDVVDALKSLCRMTAGKVNDIDLRESAFGKLQFDHHFDMSKFDLSNSIFSQASGYGAILDDGQFSNTIFRYLTLHQANIRHVQFYGTEFDNVTFEDVDFTNSSFWECKFSECEFRRCDVSGISFSIDGVDADVPIDPALLKDCWAWKNNPPKLGGIKFHGEIFDPGPSGTARKEFADLREKRRLQGLTYSEIRPKAVLKVS